MASSHEMRQSDAAPLDAPGPMFRDAGFVNSGLALESEEFRERADSLRKLAAGVVDGQFREGLLTLAADYDRKASDLIAVPGPF